MYRTNTPGNKPTGARSANRLGGCDPIIPPNAGFSLSSLSTKSFVWLKESDWDDGEKADFCRLRQVPPAVIYQPLPYIKARKRDAPRLVGRWLFQDLKQQAFGFAEVEAHVTNFSLLTVLLSPCAFPGGWTHAIGRDGLSLLISGLIIMTKADVVTLVPVDGRTSDELATVGFGDPRNLWSPYLSLARLRSPVSGIKVQTRDVDAVQWWEKAGDDRKTLAYLEKRLENEELSQKAQQGQRKKPLGLLERLNRLLRWS
jgi:hypothetical protein